MKSKELLEALEWRYAVHKFDSTKKISKNDWETLESALVLTPSSYGLQPWKFFVVQNPELRTKLRAASWNQPQVEDCSHYLVLTAKEKMDSAWISRYIQKIAEVRELDITTLKKFEAGMINDLVTGPRSQVVAEWAARQTYIALGNIMTSAAIMGIDACPMEGLDPAKYDEILGLKESGFCTFVSCAFGYRAKDDRLSNSKKVRFEKNDVITHL